MQTNSHTHTDNSGPARAASLTPRESAHCCDLHASFSPLQEEVKRLHAQTVAQLKELCVLNGLHKTGVKSDLVARLFVAERLVDALCVLRGS